MKRTSRHEVTEFVESAIARGMTYQGTDSHEHHVLIAPNGTVVRVPCTPKPRGRWKRIADTKVRRALDLPSAPPAHTRSRKRTGTDFSIHRALTERGRGSGVYTVGAPPTALERARSHAQAVADEYRQNPSGVNECRLRDALARLHLATERAA